MITSKELHERAPAQSPSADPSGPPRLSERHLEFDHLGHNDILDERANHCFMGRRVLQQSQHLVIGHHGMQDGGFLLGQLLPMASKPLSTRPTICTTLSITSFASLAIEAGNICLVLLLRTAIRAAFIEILTFSADSKQQAVCLMI